MLAVRAPQALATGRPLDGFRRRYEVSEDHTKTRPRKAP